MVQLICQNLKLGYNDKIIVNDLSFEVNSGDYLCIIGENGAGKSTLMRTILGLQKSISGSVKTSGGLEQKEIGYLPQQTVVQRDFPATVQEIVLSGCLNRIGKRPFYSKVEKDLVKENMAKVEIANLAKRCYRELSGGQQQRVLLARALCATRKMLLLDEPVSGLDPKVTKEMYDLIAKLNKEGTTIMMISHDINSVEQHATHILHIGEKCFYGTKEEYFNSEIGKKYAVKNGGNE